MSSLSRLIFFLLAVAVPISAAHAQLLRQVAVTGDSAPGTESGVMFVNVNWPALNSAGQVAFTATLSNSIPLRDQGIWSEGSGALALVVRRGDPAPGTPAGVNFDIVNDVALNASGDLAFFSGLRGAGVFSFNNVGVWAQDHGSLNLLVRSGNPAPGTGTGVNFSSNLIYQAFNDFGRSAMLAQVTGSGVSSSNDWGIWSDSPLSFVAREGTQAPGLANGVNYALLGQPRLNSAGQMLFWGRVTGTGVNGNTEDVLWSNRTGALAAVIREGSAAAGVGAGINYSDLAAIDLNERGQIAFQSHLIGGGVSSANDSGIWLEQSGAKSLRVREGDSAPGTPAGTNFAEFNSLVLNDAGQVAFRSALTGPGVGSTNGQGIWSDGFGSGHLVARTGNQAPGTPFGVVFSTLGFPVFNEAGQTAFQGFVNGSGISAATSQGIWAEDRTGLLRLIARAGDQLEVAPGDFRTIASLGFRSNSNNDSGLASGFNDAGQLAFLAQFTDGTSGVYVSSVAMIPEPSTALLLSVAFGVVWGSRRICFGSRQAVSQPIDGPAAFH